MHSVWYRTNALLTFAASVLAGMCIVTSITDLFHSSNPTVDLKVQRFDMLHPDPSRETDLARLQLYIDIDLTSTFSWNTKQVFLFIQAEYQTEKNKLNQVVLWDAIIRKKEDAKIKKKFRQKYVFDDQGRNLRNREFNLTVVWNIMPKVGVLFTQSKTFTNFTMPAEYTKSNQ